jgi:release factor glutamine methyltransferase
MRRYFKTLAGFVLIPLTRWYLRKERKFSYDDIHIRVFTGVFHPGFFGSTRFLLQFLKKQNLKNKTLLELGCGTGLISIYAAKTGADVTASDLNPKAVENCRANAKANNVQIKTVESDLFQNLSSQVFDWIIINPPYYSKKPKNDEELAWYCGEDLEYFKNLFSQIPDHTNNQSEVIMILSQACDIKGITELAKSKGFRFYLLEEEDALFDAKNFIYSIRRV